MKNFSLICAMAVTTALAFTGCEAAKIQTIKADASTIGRPATSPTTESGDDIIVPTSPSGSTGVGGTTGGTTGGSTGSTDTETDTPSSAPVCVSETDAEFCARLAKDCDSVTAADNCGAPRTAECGSCRPGFTCGGETPNVCASVTAPYCYSYDFVSTRDGYDNIYTTSTCSKEEPTKLTHNTQEETHFRNLQVSVDAQKITYDYIYAGIPDWVMSIDDMASFGGGMLIGGCRSAALNASNDRVVYVCSDGLYIGNLQDQNDTHLIASDAQDSRVFEKAVWSPVKTTTDASYGKVVFSAKEADGSNDFYVYSDVADGKQRPLYEKYSGSMVGQVILQGSSGDISPDGKTLAFVRKSAYGSQDQIWTCDLMFDQVVPANSLSPSSPRFPTETKESLCVNPRLLTSEGNNSAPHWTSNGKHLFFTSDRDGNREVYVMKADGTEEANLTNDPASDRDADTFPVRRTIDPSKTDFGRAEMAGL